MIVDNILSATQPIEIAQTERETTTFRVKAVHALLGTVAAMSFSHVLAESTDIPFVGVDVYEPNSLDLDYEYHDVDISNIEMRHQEDIEDPVDPRVTDQFIYDGTMPESEVTKALHAEYFLIDPSMHDFDLGLGLYAEALEREGDRRGKLFFSIVYSSDIAESGTLPEKVSNILGEGVPDPYVLSYMDFQYSVGTLDKLTAYADELELDNLYGLQELVERGKNEEIRNNIISILSDQYPELLEKSLVITRYTEIPDENADWITDENQEVDCVVESVGVTRRTLYGSKARDTNYMFSALTGAILGSALGMRRKKVKRNPPHMESPDTETVAKVTSGKADITDKIKVAYWQNYLANTYTNPEELRSSRNKARKAGLALVVACGSIAALPATIQNFRSEPIPKAKIQPENHTDKDSNKITACMPDQLVYNRYVTLETPDIEVHFLDPDEATGK